VFFAVFSVKNSNQSMGTNPNYTDVNIALIERCKKGERKAFQELYNLYVKAMFNISLRIVNDAGKAEEVIQDAFLKAFEKIDAYDKNYSFGVWLKRIVINRSLDVLRRKKINFVSLDEVDNYDEDEEEESIYDVEVLIKCISELSDGYRAVLTLFVFEDYSHREIATLLGISEGTSKSQYNRAKKKLIELVKQNTVTHER
jgi:RNA polymerase sigma factor (sigma-70 family)